MENIPRNLRDKKVLERRRLGPIVEWLVDEIPCCRCGSKCNPAWFSANDPVEMLCLKCQRESEDKNGMVVEVERFSQAKPFVHFDSGPGQSSGKLRKFMCYNGSENANGLWDNLIRAMED